MRLSPPLLALALLGWSPALAQESGAPPQEPTAAAPTDAAAPPTEAPPPLAAAPKGGGKRDACRQEVVAKGLRGLDRIDALQICIAQARLDCVKEAVAQKIPVAKRREFLMMCFGGGGGREEQ